MKSILKVLPDVLAAVGGCLVTWGICMIYLPAGLIAAGVFCVAAAVIAGRAGEDG